MLVMNKSGGEKLIKSSKFTLGGEMTWWAGRWGRNPPPRLMR